jgi:hypothetical protein
LRRDLRHRQVAVHRLAAGHGDGVVVEDLVGDALAGGCTAVEGGHRGAHGERAGVEVGAVAEIDEDMLGAR